MKNIDWIAKLGQQRPIFYAVLYFSIIPIFSLIFSYVPNASLTCQKVACDFSQTLYFSVVTITTLGYGDIIPTGSRAQMAAAIEALLGIVTIGLFLNSLSYAISSAAQRSEKIVQEQAQHFAEVARLRSFASIVSIYLNRYRRYAYFVTTPMQNRPGSQTITTENNKIEPPKFDTSKELGISARTDFTFNDLRDLFKSSLLLSDDHSRSTISYYFSAQDDLLTAVRNLMLGVDLSKWPELAQVCRDLIETSIALDWRGAILKWENTNLGGEPGTKFIEKMITEWQGEVKFQPSNIINAFVALDMLIRNNLSTLEKYEACVDTAMLS